MSLPQLRRLPSGELVPVWRRRPPVPRGCSGWLALALLAVAGAMVVAEIASQFLRAND